MGTSTPSTRAMLARISSKVMGSLVSGSSHSVVATSGGRPGSGA
jgi:hypothetical protein